MVIKENKNQNTLHLLNENIPFSRVLLVSDNEKKIVTKKEALEEAKKINLDLFCVAPEAAPPVCKLIDYKKYLFELSKKNKNKKKETNKEISFSFNIEENDLKVKLRKAEEWIESGSMVKFSLVMTGKEKTHPEIAYDKCQKIIADLQKKSPKIQLKDNIRKNLGSSFYFFLYKKKQ